MRVAAGMTMLRGNAVLAATSRRWTAARRATRERLRDLAPVEGHPDRTRGSPLAQRYS
jgi:hypothetical protein